MIIGFFGLVIAIALGILMARAIIFLIPFLLIIVGIAYLQASGASAGDGGSWGFAAIALCVVLAIAKIQSRRQRR